MKNETSKDLPHLKKYISPPLVYYLILMYVYLVIIYLCYLVFLSPEFLLSDYRPRKIKLRNYSIFFMNESDPRALDFSSSVVGLLQCSVPPR